RARYFPVGKSSPASFFPSQVVLSEFSSIVKLSTFDSRWRTRTSLSFESKIPRLIVPSIGGGTNPSATLGPAVADGDGDGDGVCSGEAAGDGIGEGDSWARAMPPSAKSMKIE